MIIETFYLSVTFTFMVSGIIIYFHNKRFKEIEKKYEYMKILCKADSNNIDKLFDATKILIVNQDIILDEIGIEKEDIEPIKEDYQMQKSIDEVADMILDNMFKKNNWIQDVLDNKENT